jgi:hypothetical protein
MDYRPPAASTGLPFKQTTLNLNNADFTKLNSSPIQILAGLSGLNLIICPIQINIQYENTNAGANNIFIGYEALLNFDVFTYLYSIAAASLSLKTGSITLQCNNINFAYANTSFNEPLILWMPADDPSLTFNKFYLTITYLELPKQI